VTRIFTGVDLVEIDRLAEMTPPIRARFLKRIYTGRELEICGDNDSSLAGRFAAKEAVAKALGCGIGPISWQEIEILRAENGAPTLNLHGKAQDISLQLGIEDWSISISHSQTHAMAMAVGAGSNHGSS
jgi:holo-[acyl-carrier protein] synthase